MKNQKTSYLKNKDNSAYILGSIVLVLMEFTSQIHPIIGIIFKIIVLLYALSAGNFKKQIMDMLTDNRILTYELEKAKEIIQHINGVDESEHR